LAKLLSFDKKYIFSWINLKTIFSTKSFNKTFWLCYWPSYIIDSNLFFICVHTYLPSHWPTYIIIYLPTHALTSLSTYLFTYLPTHLPIHLPTYLPIIYKMLMYTIVWYIKYESIAINELTTILIIFDPLMSIIGNLKCGYCTFNQLLWHIGIAYFGNYC